MFRCEKDEAGVRFMLLHGRELNVRFQVFTVASMKMAVFWVVAPCSLVEV
jgi:hypothetical protein